MTVHETTSIESKVGGLTLEYQTSWDTDITGIPRECCSAVYGSGLILSQPEERSFVLWLANQCTLTECEYVNTCCTAHTIISSLLESGRH